MTLKLYQIDAFTTKVFEGNPACVIPLDAWIDDTLMQKIAMENNLSETAFFVPKGEDFEIRWFTPTKEVNLCGHATLASAYVLFELLDYDKEEILFHSKSGALHIKREDDLISMDFPREAPVACTTPSAIVEAFGIEPIEVLKSVDYIVVFEDGTDLRAINPDFEALKKLDLRGVCITTIDDQYDFVSRFFAPNYGVDEDSVTGSAYTQLMPYWAKRLGRDKLFSKQVSKRGGELLCEMKEERIMIAGSAVCCIVGEMRLEGLC